jgi:hypothetical protein
MATRRARASKKRSCRHILPNSGADLSQGTDAKEPKEVDKEQNHVVG